jgi:putative ABC transport system permease protein
MAGVDRAVAVYSDIAQIGPDVVPVAAGNVGALADIFTLKTDAGELRTLRRGEIVVADDMARDRGLSVGDTVEMTMQRRAARPFTVVGIYEKSDLLPGAVLSVQDARTGFRSTRATDGYITLEVGADIAPVKDRLTALLKDNPQVGVGDQSDYVAQQDAQVNQVLVMLYILLALAIVIAVLGIVNTLALSILERTRELGLVRAIGMRRRQVVEMVIVESIVIAVFGALLGTTLGSGLGVAVVAALKDKGIPTLSLPWGSMGIFVGLALIVGLLAAVIPSVRASRVNVLEAIAYE